MLIFLYGEDTYRSLQKLKEIRGRYEGIHTQGVNLKQIDCSVFDFSDIKAELQGQSLFKEKKLLILKNVFLNSDLAQSLFENAKLLEGESDVIVFFEEGTVNKKDSLFQFLQKSASCQEFAPLEKIALKKWLLREFGSYKTKISPEAVDILATEIGNDLWRLSNEIKKLAAFASSRGASVQASEVEKFLGTHLDANIFSTIQDIALKNKKRALGQLVSHMNKGESPLYLLSMIAFQFRNLLIVRQIGKLSKLHPFVVQKTLPIAQKFTLEELKRIYQKIFAFDLGIKTGAIAPELALHVFIAQL